MRLTLCILFSSRVLLLVNANDARPGLQTGDIVEYCDDDIFNPACGDDEVIVVKHARYGRMHRGRCIPGSGGTIGCSMDIRHLLDKECSGLRSCEIPSVPRILRQYDPPCGGDLKEYLEVAIDCVKVVHSTQEGCRHAGVVEVRSNRGFLSSLVTHQTGCGSQNKPWWITANPGQRIELRLLDFAVVPASANTHPRSNVCQVYAMVKEVSRGRDETVCGSRTRESVVYMSEGNQIEVQLITGTQMDSHFLLEFEVVGCADPNPPTNGWVRRTGHYAISGCEDNTEQTWKRHCEGTQWIGRQYNCTAVKAGTTSSGKASIFHEKYQALSIMVIIGVVLCICLVILLFAVIYVKRNWNGGQKTKLQEKDQRNTSGGPLLGDGCAADYYHSSDGDYNRPKPGQDAASSGMTYPPPPYFTDRTMKTSHCTCKRGGKAAQHGYERPLSTGTGGHKDGRGNRKTDPKYYELDLDYIESSGVENL